MGSVRADSGHAGIQVTAPAAGHAECSGLEMIDPGLGNRELHAKA